MQVRGTSIVITITSYWYYNLILLLKSPDYFATDVLLMIDWSMAIYDWSISSMDTAVISLGPTLCIIITLNHKHSMSDGRGGHSLKICDGYVWPHWPPFSNRLSLNDPFLFFTFCSAPNAPIFKMLSHLMTPPFRSRPIYRWKWASCSHWMTPNFTNNRSMYIILVWKEGFM